MPDYKKKTPREIAEDIINEFRPFTDIHKFDALLSSSIEEAIQAERDEILFLKDSLHIMEQVARDRTPRELVEERDKLLEENAKLREELDALRGE
jgi:hypothetical protein